ncbi:hypothetical protein XENOCAPTIV_023835 [Xenoophorus captivus]|uniref:Secreted protein n=2 Tax=Goodeidae TaxID=28758 RepID=A0ABV0SGS5_9TELE|nr:hypothetical protein [Ataeniobius toweri]
MVAFSQQTFLQQVVQPPLAALMGLCGWRVLEAAVGALKPVFLQQVVFIPSWSSFHLLSLVEAARCAAVYAEINMLTSAARRVKQSAVCAETGSIIGQSAGSSG